MRARVLATGLLLTLAVGCKAYDRKEYEIALDSGERGPEPMLEADVGTDATDEMDVVVPTDGMDAMDADATMMMDEPDVIDVQNEPDAPMAPDNGCNPLTPPVRPPGLANTPGSTPLVFVVRRINFGFESRTLWGQHGYDRDGLCTDPARPGFMGGSCRPRGTTMPPEDGFNGRDNSFAPRLGGALQGAGWTETGSNDSITNGTATIAFRISDYGGDDDGRVQVEWLPVIHGHRPGDPVSRPMFDGMDVWHINRRIAYDIGAPSLAAVRAPNAFISGGQLVMDVPSRAPLRFAGARYPIRLTLSAGKIIGSIARPMDGPPSLGPLEFTGIWPLADALNDLTTVGVCPRDTLTYTFVTGALQGAADILGTLELGPMIECDAISIGFGLDFVNATLGPDEEDMPYNEDLCAPPDAG